MNHPGLIDTAGKTQLHYAAEANDTAMTRNLIANNHDIDVVDNQGNTPLMLAVEKNSYFTAILLVKAGANIHNLCSRDDLVTTIMSKTPGCFEAELYEYHKIVKVIYDKLRKDCDNDEQLLLTRLRDFGCSLIKVIDCRDANMTRLMLENGYYTVDDRDIELMNKTALHEAVHIVDVENVKVLLEFGASVTVLDGRRHMPMPPLDYLYRYHADQADDEDRIEILKILIEHGALIPFEIPLQNPEGFYTSRPVEIICENGDSRAITTLIQYNVDFNDYHILSSLLANEGIDALELLRGHNIDVNVQVAGQLPLLAASVYSYGWKNMQFLLKRGADPNTVDDQGETALVRVTRDQSSDPIDAALAKVRLLLQYGADAQYVINNEFTVFDLKNKDGGVLLSMFESIIAHLAMIDSVGDIGITDLIRSKIDSQETWKTYFEKCKQQLETMKETTIYESVTMYKLLTESHFKITRYARNPEFAFNFKEAMEVETSLDPYYSITLRRRVRKAIREAKLKEKAIVELNKIFCFSRNYHEILGKIVDDLTLDDLKNICKVYDL